MINLTRFAKAATVAAMTVGVAIAATPAQKASAQVVGAGASSITTLARVARTDSRLTSFGTRYVVTGSGAGRSAFTAGTTNFVATDVTLPSVPGQVVFQEATLNVAFPYNVPGFDVVIDGTTACRILRGNATLGDPTNWNQVTNASGVTGPNLPIIRVARGDSSGTTDTIQGPTDSSRSIVNGFGALSGDAFGLVPTCNGLTRVTPGGAFVPAASGFNGNTAVGPVQNPINSLNSNTTSAQNPYPAGVTVRANLFNDGTAIPNQRSTDIIVTAASFLVNNTTNPISSFNPNVDPFQSAISTSDDDNATPVLPLNPFGSYSQGIINTILNTPGAIGYTETAIAQGNGFFSPFNINYTSGLGLAADTDFVGADGNPSTTIAVGPTFVVFRADELAANPDLQNACLAFTDADNIQAAGFDPITELGPDAVSGGNPACGPGF